jgi:hypothetical protein
MYDVITNEESMSKATILFANQGHLVVVGMDRGSLQEIKALAQGEVFHTPNAKNFVIALATSKMYFVQHLFNEDGDGLVEHLKGDKFHKVMDKFIPLNTSNI